MKPSPPMDTHREQGASLVVALVFLVIMAMLGVTAAKMTTLQERMAGNTRNRDLALQAAEAALRDAELRITNDASFRAAAIPFDPTNPNDAEYWDDCFASNTDACAVEYQPTGANALPTSGGGALAGQPQYVLESKPTSGVTQIYRVTARAVGGTADTVVIHQAEFGYTP